MARKKKSANVRKNTKGKGGKSKARPSTQRNRTARKKTTGKARSSKTVRHDSQRHGNRSKATRSKATKRTKSIRSNVAAISVRPSKVYTRKQAKGASRKIEVSRYRITEGKKNKSSHSFNIGFKGGKSLRDKANALEGAGFKEAFYKQLKRKRKLPVAFILTLTDKKGQYISETSGLDEAVSAASIIKALKRSSRRKDINTDSGEKRGYKEFNPNHIVKVEVMFIYRQREIEDEN